MKLQADNKWVDLKGLICQTSIYPWVCLLEGTCSMSPYTIYRLQIDISTLFISYLSPQGASQELWGWHKSKPISPQSHCQPRICLANMVPNLWGDDLSIQSKLNPTSTHRLNGLTTWTSSSGSTLEAQLPDGAFPAT